VLCILSLARDFCEGTRSSRDCSSYTRLQQRPAADNQYVHSMVANALVNRKQQQQQRGTVQSRTSSGDELLPRRGQRPSPRSAIVAMTVAAALLLLAAAGFLLALALVRSNDANGDDPARSSSTNTTHRQVVALDDPQDEHLQQHLLSQHDFELVLETGQVVRIVLRREECPNAAQLISDLLRSPEPSSRKQNRRERRRRKAKKRKGGGSDQYEGDSNNTNCEGCNIYRAEPVPEFWGSPELPDTWFGYVLQDACS